jgi:enoyl reductase-like protein
MEETVALHAGRRYVGGMHPGERLWLDTTFRLMLETTLRDVEERFKTHEHEFERTLRENGVPHRSGSPPEERRERPW